jgi:hypothetical protein
LIVRLIRRVNPKREEVVAQNRARPHKYMTLYSIKGLNQYRQKFPEDKEGYRASYEDLLDSFPDLGHYPELSPSHPLDTSPPVNEHPERDKVLEEDQARPDNYMPPFVFRCLRMQRQELPDDKEGY